MAILNFSTNESREIIRICPNGEIYVNGNLIGNDKEVVSALKEVLKPEISKGKLYNEMLEMLKELSEWFEADKPGIKDLQEDYLNKVENLIKKATEL